jgi:AcrR family transcriptional regulator
MSRARDGVSTRAAILSAATELFASKGYHATGVQELSDAVGLGRGALYHHIKSKEDLLYEISIGLMRESIEDASLIVTSTSDPEEKLRQFVRRHIRGIADNRATWTIVLHESRALAEERRQDIVAARLEYEGLWTAVLANLARAYSVPALTDLTRRGVLGMLNSPHLWLESSGPVSPEDVADEYSEFIMQALKAAPAA